MGTDAQVGEGFYNMQQVYHQPQELREYYYDYSVTLTPAISSDASRVNSQHVDMSTDIKPPMHIQSPYLPQNQYPVMSPTDFDKSYQTSQIQGETIYSRYSGVNLSPPHAVYHPEVHCYTPRKLSSPAVTFRNPFTNHQNHRAYVHSSPPLSPTDMRGFRGDLTMLRRWQDGAQ